MEFIILENILNPITDFRSIRNYCFVRCALQENNLTNLLNIE